ncbi:YrbL family protein [Ereboglobus luteus]|uniref:PhoP regulatory network protein YrbL n=1 Tax=Ereboglobus luteus TaxID=1796921 RepID=A0A2U8E322_9BACT|nr:YrbL family protein [Ereboglobus luteus]AWI09278.1 hypothetical protein CKA38_08505 [Ereboglobus luteus]
MSQDITHLPLKLSHRTPIAVGGHRMIYAHPHNDSLVLKVPKPEFRQRTQASQSFWRRHFDRFKYYSDTAREAIEHMACYAANEARPPFLQRFYGFLETDLGLASVSGAERDEEGNYALNFTQIIKQGKFDKKVRAALEEFAVAFVANDVVVGDLRPDNMVYSFDRETSRMRFVIIDGIGDKNAIKLCSYFRFYNRMSKRKRIKFLRKQINWLLSENAGAKNEIERVDDRAMSSMTS